MADTLTTNLSLTKPEVGASADTWGTKINNDLDSIDGLFSASGDLAVANGGTGASTAADARTNLGVVIGTDVAPVASPALTGVPTAPTATAGTSTTQLATTAFVGDAVTAYDAALTVPTSKIENDAVTTAKIAPTGVSAGTYGSASAIPVVTVNAEGQVTSASTQAVVPSLRLISKTQVFGAGTPNGGTISVSLPTSLFNGNTPSFVMFSANARVTGQTDLRYFYMCSGTNDTQQNMVLASSSDDTDQGGAGRGDAASTFILPYSASQSFYTALYGATLYINVIGYQL